MDRWQDTDTDPVPGPDYPLSLILSRSRGHRGVRRRIENPYTRYELSAHSANYPAEFFAAAPDLESCGLDDSASQTWMTS